ncbi:helix-turn-helix transcriptional regulator [Brevibacterium epidermidis]|jgi:predicted DNA-binding transcriptional regulator AlpA|uniref:helix-turn-helix transcriptional regulator n=1 Tax=Brevibacterium epidermidis TaxID=1698 RepID=UPI0035111C41
MSDPAIHAVTVDHIPLHDRAGLSTSEASAYTSLSAATLKKYRCNGTGPRYARIGSKIVYRPSDLDDYIGKHLIGGNRR